MGSRYALRVGAATMDKVREVMLEYPEATLVTPQPVLKGMMGERTQPGLEHLKVSVEEGANAKLIVENIDQFDREIEFERVRNSYRQSVASLISLLTCRHETE